MPFSGVSGTRRTLFLRAAALYLVLGAVAITAGVATYALLASSESQHHVAAAARPVANVRASAPAASRRVPAVLAVEGATPAPPSADEFASVLVSLTNEYASAHGDATRLAAADCVEAARGRYMCSYAAVGPDGIAECRIMQARWTPRRASTFTVTLAGRVTRCATLRDALQSLS